VLSSGGRQAAAFPVAAARRLGVAMIMLLDQHLWVTGFSNRRNASRESIAHVARRAGCMVRTAEQCADIAVEGLNRAKTCRYPERDFRSAAEHGVSESRTVERF